MGAIGYYRRVSERFARGVQADAKVLKLAFRVGSFGGINVGKMAELARKQMETAAPQNRHQYLDPDLFEQAAKQQQREADKHERLLAASGFSESDFARELCIYKAAHELEKLVARLSSESIRIVVEGGTSCSEDFGYGPAYLIDAGDVKRAAQALLAIPEGSIGLASPPQPDPIAAKYNEMMAQAAARGVLPGLDAQRPSSGDPLRDLFLAVRNYFEAASTENRWMLRWFT